MGSSLESGIDKYVAEDIEKYKGVLIPVRSSLLRRMLVRKVKCTSLHPNPEDEFSIPSVGPSYRIISEYERRFRTNEEEFGYYYTREEPIVIERVYPEGYMILNGHHRWAAAMRIGYPKIRVSIVNVMHEEDIKQIIQNSNHHKRVTMDLDEVVFCREGDSVSEKALSFPLNRFYPQRLKLGIPALFHFLEKSGYDIWVYSAKYYSFDYIQDLFRRYHVHVDGIVTGTEKKHRRDKEKKKLDSLMESQYRFTLHIDTDMVLQTFSGTKQFEEFNLKGTSGWSQEVIELIGEIDQNG